MSNYQSSEIKLINTSLIDPHPDNPRKQIGDVTDLAASIKANGLLSPLSVVPNGERFRVIAGHRRLAACKQAGTDAVPCFVLDLTPLQQLEAMVTENCQREQLTVLEEADAIQGMLDLGATTSAVAHRLGRSTDYVRDRVKAASITADVRQARDDFDQLTIGQLIAISRYDGQPDRQERLTRAAGTSNFDYLLTSFERDDKLAAWFDAVTQKLESGTTGLNVIPDPENTFSDPEWRFDSAVYAGDCVVEDTIKEIREADPEAVSVHQANKQIYLWKKRDKAAEEAEDARIDAERAAAEAQRHALHEYAATSYGRRAAWLGSHLHGITHDKLTETAARLGLLQIIDPQPDGYTRPLTTWNNTACAAEQFATISGIKPEHALADLRHHLDEPDWPRWAVMILSARIEWFIDPEDWTMANVASRRIPGYYRILQDLGYQPADDETSHLDQLIAAITEADSDENEEDEENNQ